MGECIRGECIRGGVYEGGQKIRFTVFSVHIICISHKREEDWKTIYNIKTFLNDKQFGVKQKWGKMLGQ